MKVGITGQNGFIGKHLFNTLSLYPDNYQLIPFERFFFNNSTKLDEFVKSCDVIVHLAGMNRHENQREIYNTNINLAKRLVQSLQRNRSIAHIIFSSSSQEESYNPYGRSKKESRLLFQNWAVKNDRCFNGLIIPNVYGPFGKPYYNSVISTFCHQLCNDENPIIDVDNEINLIYVGDLVESIIKIINCKKSNYSKIVPFTNRIKVSALLEKLQRFHYEYLTGGIIPELTDKFDVNLFNTFRSFIDYRSCFPRTYTQHTDVRGSFIELIRTNGRGQVSFSSTAPGVTRGDHFHTRKIERFSVIRGKAQIQLRKIGGNLVHNYKLDGKNPAYVDIPIWYAHNITNIGSEELITIFWINEFYDDNDPDTYFVEVKCDPIDY